MKLWIGLWMLSASCLLAAQNNPVPLVNDALSPTSIAPGSPSFTLTVYGAGFASTAIVNWNGSTRLTSVISARELKASISASDVAKAGTAWITVSNPAPGGGTSNVIFFPITRGSSASGMAINLVAPQSSVAAVGDFNNDGKLDVVFGGVVYLGNGKGGFLGPKGGGSFGYGQLLTGDFNGDGKLDIVTVDGSGFVIVALGKGDGTFTTSWAFQARGGGNTIAVGDFNQDGHLDLYIMGYMTVGQQWFDIYLGRGDGTFAQGARQTVAYYAGIPAVADFNGDGILDLAVPNLSSRSSMDIFLGRGNGFFNFLGTAPFGAQRQVMAADFNHDGKIDLLTDTGCVLLGNGDGTFGLGGCSTLGGNGLAGIGDFNGDGNLDAVFQSSLGTDLLESPLLGAGNGTFLSSHTFDAGAFFGNVGSGGVGDFNNDGLLDIAAPDGYVLLQTTVNLTPVSLSFGNQNVGTKSPPQTATLSNVGKTALTLQGISFAGTGASSFLQTNNCGTSLAAGASCAISAVFKPLAAGPVAPALKVSYLGTASPQAVAVSGVGLTSPTVSLLPATLAFGAQLVGTTSTAQTATLSNTNSQDVTITKTVASGAFSQTNNCPATLPSGAGCQIQVVFSPKLGGAVTGSIAVTDNAKGSPQHVRLAGTGTVVSFSPVSVNFGNQKVGTQSGIAAITLSNVGATALTISKIALVGANPGDFSQTNNCGTGVPAKGSCTINVRFKPTVQGTRSASVGVTDNGGASPQSVPLTGTGT